jgi:hypothetical protein
MKFFLPLAGALLLITILAFVTPKLFHANITIASLMIDKSDSFIVHPDKMTIQEALHLHDDKWQSVTVRISTISDVDYNMVTELRLPAHDILFSNPIARDQEMGLFDKQVCNTIDSANKEHTGLPKTSVYIPIVQECNRLAAMHADKKYLFYYGDLFENTNKWSIYRKGDRALLVSDEKRVEQLFKAQARPVNLDGLEVYFIFKPASTTENEYYASAAQLFKSLLEAAGAKVHTGANADAVLNNEP